MTKLEQGSARQITPEGFNQDEVKHLLRLKDRILYEEDPEGSGKRPYHFIVDALGFDDAINSALAANFGVLNCLPRYRFSAKQGRIVSLYPDIQGIFEAIEKRKKGKTPVSEIVILLNEGNGVVDYYQQMGIDVIMVYKMNKVNDFYLREGKITPGQHKAATEYLSGKK